MRRLSPIERMIDEACGYKPDTQAQPKVKYVTLHCPKCGRKQKAKLDPTDPPGTSTVDIQCPKCVKGDFDSPVYFDANDKELSADSADGAPGAPGA